MIVSCSPVYADLPDHATPPPDALHPSSRWLAVSWDELPSFFSDNPREALGAWLASCARPQPLWNKACSELALLKNADADVLRFWMRAHLQPYRVESLQASSSSANGLLTGYYEPIFKASRAPTATYRYPLYRLPAQLTGSASRSLWHSRQDIETAGSPAHQALQGRELAFLDNPLDVLALHIQGSGQLEWIDDSSARRIRVAYAGSNNQPYKSVGAWLRETHGVRDLSWASIKAWALANPERTASLLASNPRYVFFQAQAVASHGPRGAQGIPLTAGRSIAVDPKSIPYGTPVWLASRGETLELKRLVLAQDTGAAIVGAVRADLYLGSGEAAGELAGKLKQDLQLWVLWPK